MVVQNEDVTVIIPTYHSERFIERTIRSVLAQTSLPAEIIIVDDHSADGTVPLVSRLSETSIVPIKIVTRKTGSGGPAVPLNEGIAAAQTSWLSLLDHDDEMQPQKLEKQISAANAFDSKFVFSDWSLFKHEENVAYSGLTDAEISRLKARAIAVDGENYFLDSKTSLQEQILNPGLVQSCSNLFFHRDLFAEYGPFDAEQTVICDYILKLDIATEHKSAFIAEQLFIKHQHGENLFDNSVSVDLMCKIFSVGIQTLKQHPELYREDGEFQMRLLSYLESYCVTWRNRGFIKEARWLALQIPRVCGMNIQSLTPFLKWLRYVTKYKLRFKKIPNT